MRLFLALWPDETVRRRIHRAGRLAVAAGRGRPVPAGNLHLTLAFLGEVADTRREAVAQAAAAAAASVGPFELSLTDIGIFQRGTFGRAGVLWLGGPATEPLTALVRDLKDRLIEAGFGLDRKPFRPHLTLARKLPPLAQPARGTTGPLDRAIAWSVSEIALIASVTDPAGARYQMLQTWPLRAA